MLVIGAEHHPPAVLAAHQIALGLFYLWRKKDPRSIAAGLALQHVILSTGHSSLTFKMGSGWGRLGLYSNGPHEMHPHTQLCESLASLHHLLPSSP